MNREVESARITIDDIDTSARAMSEVEASQVKGGVLPGDNGCIRYPFPFPFPYPKPFPSPQPLQVPKPLTF